MYKGRKVTVIICAGGMGVRFGTPTPKQFLDVGGESMLVSAARPFAESGYMDELIFVVPRDFLERARELVTREMTREMEQKGDGSVLPRFVCGGADRAASVRAGLDAVTDESEDGLVLIHDAARPFVSTALIERVLDAAFATGAVVPTIPVGDTIYVVSADGTAAEIPGRENLRAAQTPQGFDRTLIRAAHARAAEAGLPVTDDGTPVFSSGGRVTLVEGELSNRKITHAEDIPVASAARVGVGFDAHRFEDGRPLYLGGVLIPFERGLLGHSDADVLTHALMDAILGALGAGDIGRMFPDTDARFKNISSMKLLAEVVRLMRGRGYEIGNADLTLVAERPRMAPYRDAVERTLADALGTAPENISVKATTTEKLGFTGREEGIAAEAVVLLQKE